MDKVIELTSDNVVMFHLNSFDSIKLTFFHKLSNKIPKIVKFIFSFSFGIILNYFIEECLIWKHFMFWSVLFEKPQAKYVCCL